MAMEMEKREMLKHKQLMIWARTGYWVTQSSLDEVYVSDDELVLQQIEALKQLREQYPRLAKDINGDLFELLSNPNAIRIKTYNEQYATNMRNNTEEEMIEVLFWLSVFENSGLTQKQKDLLLDIVEGFSYEGRHKDFGFMCKKIEKSKEKCKMSNDNKRKFTNSEMQKLFPNYYNNPNERWDCYLNYNRKLDCYNEDVEQSKIRMDRIRQLSLATAIFPLELECNEVREED